MLIRKWKVLSSKILNLVEIIVLQIYLKDNPLLKEITTSPISQLEMINLACLCIRVWTRLHHLCNTNQIKVLNHVYLKMKI